MQFRHALVALSLTALLALPALAQVKLEQKQLEGKTATVDTTAKVEQKLTIAGMEIETTSDTQTTQTLTSGKRDADGKLKVEEKYDSLQVQMKVMGSEYLFDSKNPDKEGSSPLEGVRKIHQVMSRSKTTKVYDKANKLVEIKAEEDLLNGLDDAIKALVRDQVDPEKMKKSANEEAERIPATPVKKGDTWDHTSKVNLGGGQVMTFVAKYSYEGEIEKNGKKLDKIGAKITGVELAIEGDSPIKYKAVNLKPTESKEELYFDRSVGQVVESTSKVVIKGELTLVVNGMELPAKLDLTMESTTLRK